MSKGNFIFDSVKTPNPPRNKFDVPWESFGSYKIGPCYPLFAIPMFPGDRFRGSSDMLIRALPMIAPTMGPLKAYVHYFFIPNRLVWQDWEKFITGGEDGTYVGFSRCVTVKSICARLRSMPETKLAFLPGGLIDHLFGWCFDSEEDIANCADQTPLDTLPIAMYALLFREYYCDQNVDDVATLDVDLQTYFKATMEGEVLNATLLIIESLNRIIKKAVSD